MFSFIGQSLRSGNLGHPEVVPEGGGGPDDLIATHHHSHLGNHLIIIRDHVDTVVQYGLCGAISSLGHL